MYRLNIQPTSGCLCREAQHETCCIAVHIIIHVRVQRPFRSDRDIGKDDGAVRSMALVQRGYRHGRVITVIGYIVDE